MEAIPHILAYTPPAPRPNYGSPEAQVFKTKEGQTVSYKGFTDDNGRFVPYDHNTCLIANEWAQEAISQVKPRNIRERLHGRPKTGRMNATKGLLTEWKEVRETEIQGENGAFLDMVFRTALVGMILGGQLLHYVGIDVPLVGGPLSSARSGLFVACIDYKAAPLALLHTLVTRGPFIGPSGLLTRGLFFWLVTEAVRYGICLPAQIKFRQTFDFPMGDQSTRANFNADYQALWEAIREDLECKLDQAIKENSDLDDKLAEKAKKLLDKETHLRQIYGLNTAEMRNELGVICRRIWNYRNGQIPREKLQAIRESMADYPLTLEARRTELAPYAQKSGPKETREDVTLKEVNRLLLDAPQKRVQVRGKGNELVAALCPRFIESKTERPSEEKTVDDIYWIRALCIQARHNAKKSSDPSYLQDFENIQPLVQAFEKAVEAYEALAPLPEAIKQAIVIATLMAEQDDDTRFGHQQREAILELAGTKGWENRGTIELRQARPSDAQGFNKWVNGMSKKLLDELKRGLVSGNDFVQWVETLAPREDRAEREFEEVNLDRYKFWDQYERLKAAPTN